MFLGDSTVKKQRHRMRRNPLKFKSSVQIYFIVNVKREYELAAVLENYLLSGIAEAEGSSQLQQKPIT
jgi:hypothetical protein